ncbi:MAG: tetratricopeptide repeat protein [Alphaproteobacteria bacterium]|nr:tetratricopeptide repeat protein [Alphaproteobacteria bacterium]MCB9695957.1 tetratricopeptide repeat protein [Alphaproteobacteria bacterium]
MRDPSSPSTRRIGRYELLRPIGRGGGGEVWEAVLHGPQGFRKGVAVKLLREGPAEHDAEALVREARLGALLSHPNVVSTLELGYDEGAWFVAMELVHGPSLAEVARAGPLSAPALLDAGLQICAALAHVHRFGAQGDEARGLVHRDVKPQNLLLDRSGIVKLADLGIARFAGGVGGVSGTPGYMAPEQALGREDARADLFSLGVTLFVLATGERPFGSGAVAWEGVRWVEERLADPAFLAPLDERLPGLGAVVARCLRLDPAHRFQRAAEVSVALRSLRPPPGPSLLELFARVRPDQSTDDLRGWTPAAREVAASVVGNLPPAPGPLLGRTQELAGVGDRLRDQRLVTLLGPGGMGKTRLALEVARAVESRYAGGAWFCDLSEARTGFGIAVGVAQALGVPLLSADPSVTVGHALRVRGRTLLVLDNLEQVVDHAPDTVGAWLRAAPDVSFLVTSQRALHLDGEVVVVLGPLGRAAGAELFVARAARPPAPAERGEVEALVEALDGLPLAIELAAARTRLMGVAAIRERLDQRFKLLAGAGAERPARHRSLRASLETSWELLEPVARRALSRLSVFSGGFTLEAAEDLLAGHPDAPWALDQLDELVGASFVLVDGDRFRMLVSVVAFAAEHLLGEERLDSERRHGRFYAERARSASPRERTIELDNLIVAARRAVERGDGEVAAPTTLAAVAWLEDQGPYAVAMTLLDDVLDRSDLGSAPDRIRLLRARARIGGRWGRPERALADAEAALALARSVGEGVEQALEEVASQLRDRGRHLEAVPLLEEAVASARARGDLATVAAASRGLGGALHRLGRYAEAQQALEEALRWHRERGELDGEAIVLSNLAGVYTDQARHQDARDVSAAAVAIHRDAGNRRLLAGALANLGLAEVHLGRCEPARAALQEARSLHQALGDRRGEAMDLAHLARVHGSDGRTDDARTALHKSLVCSRELGDLPRVIPTLMQLGVLEHIAGRVADARAAYAEALELAERSHEARFAAQASMNLGMLLAESGELEAGVTALRRAHEGYASLGLDAGAALSLGNLGGALQHLGRTEEAFAALEEGVRIARGTTSAWALGNLLLELGELKLDDGDLDAGLPLTEEGARVLSELGRDVSARSRAALCRARRERGDLQGAERVLAFDPEQSTSQDTVVPAWLELAQLRLAQGRLQEAQDAAERASELSAAFLPFRVRAGCVRAEALYRAGRDAEAAAVLSEAERVADRIGAVAGSPLRRELAAVSRR